MTLYEYTLLHNEEQAISVWQDGEFVTFRDMSKVTAMLYKQHYFCVEIYYNNENNSIMNFNSVSSGNLELYIEMNLN